MKKSMVPMGRALLLSGGLAMAALSGQALAADPVKIGLILPMSGAFATTGKQVETAVRLYQQKYGDTVAGRKIEIILKDDGGKPDASKQIAQELIVKDKVNILAGFGLTPIALTVAPLATQSKIPMVVMVAATSIVTSKSPYIVRSGFTVPQVTAPLADWASKNKIGTVISMVSDYGPGLDAERVFNKRFSDNGGKVVDALRVPLLNPDLAPFMQRVKDAKPDALFAFVPSGEGAAVVKQFQEKGLAAAGIKLIGLGDVLDDDLLPAIGQAAAGMITTHHYSAAHDSPENKAYVEGMKKLGNVRANMHSVGGYDGMHIIYEALKKTNGDSDGDKLVEAMKGLKWISPRGPVSIDPASRETVQTVYVRQAKVVKGEVFNVEFDKIENVRDPGSN